MYKSTRGAAKAVATNNKSLDNLVSPEQLALSETFAAASAIGLKPGTPESIIWQIKHAGTAAILSVQMKFETNFIIAGLCKYQDYAQYDENDQETVNAIKAGWKASLPKNEGHRANFLSGHVKGVIRWHKQVNDQGLAMLKHADETWEMYRVRLTKSYFVADKVASFISLLLYPTTSELATLDTWMCSMLGFVKKNATDSPTKRQYRVLEAKLAVKRAEMGLNHVPLGLYQWCVWDFGQAVEGSVKFHSHIEASLT